MPSAAQVEAAERRRPTHLWVPITCATRQYSWIGIYPGCTIFRHPQGLGLVRRSTATSCRKTSSSAFLDADERPTGPASRRAGRRSGRAGAGTRLTIMPCSRTSPQVTGPGHLLAPDRAAARSTPSSASVLSKRLTRPRCPGCANLVRYGGQITHSPLSAVRGVRTRPWAAGWSGRPRNWCGIMRWSGGQPVLAAVSSMTNEVCSEASSLPVNFSVIVWPA